MSNYTYAGAVAPEALAYVVSQGQGAPDLSVVSAATLHVRYPDGTTTRIWPTTLSAQSSSSLTLTHSFALGDIDQIGNYYVVAFMTVPNGTIRSVPRLFQVVDQFQQ